LGRVRDRFEGTGCGWGEKKGERGEGGGRKMGVDIWRNYFVGYCKERGEKKKQTEKPKERRDARFWGCSIWEKGETISAPTKKKEKERLLSAIRWEPSLYKASSNKKGERVSAMSQLKWIEWSNAPMEGEEYFSKSEESKKFIFGLFWGGKDRPLLWARGKKGGGKKIVHDAAKKNTEPIY